MMTKIEQINLAKQILGESSAPTERNDEAAKSVKSVTATNLKLRQELDEMTAKRDKAREDAHRHLSAMAYWRKRAVQLGKNEELLEAAGRVNAGMTKRIEELTKQLEQAREFSQETAETNANLTATNAARAREIAELRTTLVMTANNCRLAESDRDFYQEEMKRLKERVNKLVRERKASRRLAA